MVTTINSLLINTYVLLYINNIDHLTTGISDMSDTIDNSGMLDAIAVLSERIIMEDGPDAIVSISGIDGRVITEFEVLGKDMPAVADACKKAVNEGLLHRQQVLEAKLEQLRGVIGNMPNPQMQYTAKMQDYIVMVKDMTLRVLPKLDMVTTEEALMVIDVIDNIKVLNIDERTQAWAENIIKQRFDYCKDTKKLILKPDDQNEEDYESQIKRVLNQTYPHARMINARMSEQIRVAIANKNGGMVMTPLSDKWLTNFFLHCYKVESESNFLVSEGFVVDDGEKVFMTSKAALLYLRKQGHFFKDFAEAHNASEDGIIEPCWHEDFMASAEL